MERYYSMNFYRWPLRAFLSSCWRNSALETINYFPLLMYRRIPFFRPIVTYGYPFGKPMHQTELESLPSSALPVLSQRIREIEVLGFGEMHCFEYESIGTIKQYLIVLLHQDGDCRIHIGLNLQVEAGQWIQQHNYMCTSALATGGAVISSPESPEGRYPELLADDVQEQVYPLSTTIEELVDYHRQSIPAQARLRTFNDSSLPAYLSERVLLQTEHMLQKKLYYELSSAEVERIKAIELPAVE